MTTIGIEIDARAVRAVRLIRRRDGRQSWSYRVHSRGTELADDVRHVLRPWRGERLRASVVVAAPSSQMRRLTVRAATETTVAEAAKAQLRSLLPFDVDQAHVQYALEAQERQGAEIEAVVSVGACERSVLDHTLEAVWQAGWPVSAVVPGGAALLQAACVLQAIGQEPAVLLEFGARQTTIALIEAGQVVYARDVALGEEHLTDALTGQVTVGDRTVALTADEARRLKASVGVPESATAASAANLPLPLATYLSLIQPILEQIVAEVRRTMALESGGASDAGVPARLIISGDGSRLPNIAHWLSGQLGVPVSRLHGERVLGEEGANAVVACGAVLAVAARVPSLNLQPASWHQRGTLVRLAALLWKGLALAAVVVGVSTWVWMDRSRVLARDVSALRQQWAELAPVVSLRQTLQAHEELLRHLMAEQVAAEWFQQLARDFPAAVRLEHLSVKADGTVELSGQAQGWDQTPEATVSELTLWLEQQQVCRTVMLGPGRRNDAAQHLADFSLTCHRP